MGEEEVEAIKSRLKPELGKVDKFKIQIDKSIIGGFKAKTNNVLIDSSIKTLIGSIRKKLV
jgi:F0F1-type ATP synthase delta subunit